MSEIKVFLMNDFLLFGLLSIPVLIVSMKSLQNPRSHGFYRFFAWECMLWIFTRNWHFWFKNWLSWNQLISWLLLLIATYFVLAGVVEFQRKGKASHTRKDKELFGFEKTTELVDSGIFAFIRHPMYSSLFLLTWAIFFKKPGIELAVISLLASVLLFVMVILEEKECTSYFGEKYLAYKKRTKMFIPFLV